MDDNGMMETSTWSAWFLEHVEGLAASADCLACILVRRAEAKAKMLELSVESNQGPTIVAAWAREAREAHDLAVSADHSCGMPFDAHRF